MFLKKTSFLILSSFFFSSCVGQAVKTMAQVPKSPNANLNLKTEVKVEDLKVHKETFSNGLKVLIVENHKLPIFSYYTFFDVGSRNEPEGLYGGTHLLEHLMFKGTEKFKEGDFQQLLEEKGGETNAYTSNDVTVYHANLPLSLLPTIVDLESDRMSHLVINKESLEKEKLVVLEERRMRYENAPQSRAHQKLFSSLFDKTPYAHPVIGSEEDIKGLNQKDIYTYFKRYYSPNNAILVIVGDVDTNKTIALLKEKYGPIAAANDLDEYKKKNDDQKKYVQKINKEEIIRLHGPNAAGHFFIGFKGESAGTKRAYALDILASILADGESSYLSQNYIMGKNPLLSSIRASSFNMKYGGVFFIEGDILEKVTVKVAREKILKDFKTLCAKAIDDRNVQKIKNQYLVGFYEGLKTNAGVASLLGTMERLFGDYSYYKKDLAAYQDVKTQDVKKVCLEMIPTSNWTFVSLWKFNRKENEQ